MTFDVSRPTHIGVATGCIAPSADEERLILENSTVAIDESPAGPVARIEPEDRRTEYAVLHEETLTALSEVAQDRRDAQPVPDASAGYQEEYRHQGVEPGGHK